MDWSVLKAHANHPLLRNDLLYSNYVPVELYLGCSCLLT